MGSAAYHDLCAELQGAALQHSSCVAVGSNRNRRIKPRRLIQQEQRVIGRSRACIVAKEAIAALCAAPVAHGSKLADYVNAVVPVVVRLSNKLNAVQQQTGGSAG